jgi:hypothetical protein
MSEVEFIFLTRVLTQNLNTLDLVKFLEKNKKTSHLDHNSHIHNILEPVLGRPFGYSAKHCSKSLLKKDFIPFLSSYAHSFTGTYTILPLE